MPRIPIYNQRAGLSISNPTGFQNASSAGGSDEKVADFGAALAKTAVTMDSFFKERNKAKRATDAEAFAIDSGLKSLEVRGQIKSLPPEERLKAYSEEMDKAMTPQLDKFGDSETRAKAANEYGRVKLANLNSLFNETAKDSIDLGKLKNQETHAKYLEFVRQTPEAASTIIAQSDKLVEESGMLYDPVEKEALKQQNRRDIVEMAVNTNMNAGKFGVAKKTLSDLSAFADPKQLTQLDEEINSKQVQWDYKTERDAQKADKEYADTLEEQRTSKALNYNLKMIQARTGEERQAILEDAKNEALLSPSDLDNLEVRVSKKVSAEQNGFASDLASQIIDAKGPDLKRLGNSLKTAHKAGLIDDGDYERLYRTWDHKLNEKNGLGPKSKRMYSNPEFKRQDSLAKEQLDIAFPKPRGDMAFLMPEANQMRVDARNAYEDLVAKGARPRDAIERAIRTVSPDPASIPNITGAEGIDQTTVEGVQAAARIAKQRFNNGAKTPEREKYYKEQLMRASKKTKAIKANQTLMQMRTTVSAAPQGGSTSVE